MAQYRQEQQNRYEREGLIRKNYLNKTRAVSRLQEFYNRGELSHVIAGGHTKKHISISNEEPLQESLDWSMPADPKTLQDMEWAARQYLFWLECQGIDNTLDVNAHSFSGFMTMAAGKYSEGSLHDLQLFLKKFHQFLNTEKGLDIPYGSVLSLPVIRKKRVFPPLTKDDIQRTVAQIDRSTVMWKRDHAIILLGARNGLRGCDIIHLKLTNIDQRAGEIRIVQKKTGNPLVLPLLPDVGEALKEYILNGRPDSSSEFIFLRAMPMTKKGSMQHPDCGELTEHLIMPWVLKDGSDTKGIKARASAIRLLAQYMNLSGQEAYVLPDRYFGDPKPKETYIFSDDELSSLFSAIDALPEDNKIPYTRQILPVLFRLIYTLWTASAGGKRIKKKKYQSSNR